MASAIIQEIRTVSGNQPRSTRYNEKAGQTFVSGTPLMIDTGTGSLQAWDGTTLAVGIAGIGKEFGANLATTGVAQQQTYGSVPNQPSAQNISRPYFNDGKTQIIIANEDTVFYAQVGPSQTTAVTDLAKVYGMTKDSDGHWFVDKTKTGANAVCTVTGLDAVDTTRGVHIMFLPAAIQNLA